MKHGIVLTKRCLTKDFFNKYFIEQFDSDYISVEDSYFFKKDGEDYGLFLLRGYLSKNKIYYNLEEAIGKMVDDKDLYDENLDACVEQALSTCRSPSFNNIILPKVVGIYEDEYIVKKFFKYITNLHTPKE